MRPLLWNIFVHDLLPEMPFIKYADDTTVYDVVESSEVEVENSMLLNVTKSQSLTLTLQKNIICDPIKINDIPISQNSSVKLLGGLL